MYITLRTWTCSKFLFKIYVDLICNADVNQYNFSEFKEEIEPCRFCLNNKIDNQMNPFVNPWSCKGTQGFIHVDWLKSWINSKRVHKVFYQFADIYTWRTENWEMCNSPYLLKYDLIKMLVCLIWWTEKTIYNFWNIYEERC